MTQTENAEQVAEVRNDPAFRVDEVNLETGEVVLIIQKGILGAMANQLKNTSNRRKGASIVRKLGYVLAECGNIHYGGDVGETDIDPEIVFTVSPDDTK
jgi:hypothetical protein